ncbi:MAG: phosphatidylserine decarboxylase family protein [Flavobacteriales bacterium CG03_land_8_20_14_0_80_35_15]|nr:MAG: phosphatidylserine decarboxylase family protein [Flavobacteriales bacterium CG03_land_8_20_14_0_80_35_15]
MFHKEGFKIISIAGMITVVLILTTDYLFGQSLQTNVLEILILFCYVMILQFFRNPKRVISCDDTQILAPADGKVVVIEEVFEAEFFKDKRRQISIFMSPLNVHVTRYPIGGIVKYSQYHPGKYLVAWHPKSSTENERTSIVVENEKVGPILYRQIAGALARRIVNYAKPNAKVSQGADAGFIKFGSRIDIFVPLNFKINVQLNDKAIGGKTVIASVL